jgi:hypothetical protein
MTKVSLQVALLLGKIHNSVKRFCLWKSALWWAFEILKTESSVRFILGGKILLVINQQWAVSNFFVLVSETLNFSTGRSNFLFLILSQTPKKKRRNKRWEVESQRLADTMLANSIMHGSIHAPTYHCCHFLFRYLSVRSDRCADSVGRPDRYDNSLPMWYTA